MIRKGVPNRRGSRGRMVVRLLVFGAALTGLFAMHGLSGHGAASHGINAPMSPAMVTTSHSDQMTDDMGSATEAAGMADGAPGRGSSGIGIAGLCLALLAGAIIGFLLLRPHRSVILMGPIALPFASAQRYGRWDRDPPCLFELSVLRT